MQERASRGWFGEMWFDLQWVCRGGFYYYRFSPHPDATKPALTLPGSRRSTGGVSTIYKLPPLLHTPSLEKNSDNPLGI